MRRRPPAIFWAPFLAFLALLAWAFASPIGASPDDDFHLVSTWCSNVSTDLCEPGSEPDTRRVAGELVEIAECFAQHPEQSAACQNEIWNGGERLQETDRGNFAGAYPPVFYSVMSVFAVGDIQVAALLMRVVTILLFLGITVALWVALPEPRRPTLIWGWLITTMPLGIFLLASNNPSAWAVIGVGSAWIALLGYFETEGWRRILLGSLFALSVLMAAGSRGDAALYVGFAIAIVLLLTFVRSKRWWLQAILPAAMGLVALVFFLTSRQTGSGLGGFGGGSTGALPGADGGAEALSGFALFAYNVLNVPFLWAGAFGEWGLGWLDTSMPAVVSLVSIAVFVAVGFVGLGRVDLRKAIAVALTGLVLWMLPVYVLQAGNDAVGDQVQPRYLLPLIVLIGGLLMLVPRGRVIRFTTLQLVLVAAALSGVNFVALHMNIRRYVTGIDAAGPNLEAGAEWWWSGLPFGPNVVWIVGSLAYAGLLAVVVWTMRPRRPVPVASEPQTALPMTR